MAEITSEDYQNMINDNVTCSSVESNLKQRIEWALTKPSKIVKVAGVKMSVLKKEAEKREKEWGNSMIGQKKQRSMDYIIG